MTRINYKIFMVIVALTLCVGALAMPKHAISATELTYNVWIPRMAPEFQVLVVQWIEEVERESKGRIKVNVPPASLGPPPRSFDLVTSGTADIAFMSTIYKRNEWRLPRISEIPFTASSSEAATVALWRTYKKYFEKADEFKGVNLLSCWAITSPNIESLKKDPILSLKQMQGFKMRTEPGTLTDILKNLNVPVVSTQGMKAFEMVSKGAVDGNLFPFFASYLLKLSNYVKNVTVVPGGIYRSAFAMFMNQETYDNLSPEDKKVIDDASGEKLARRAAKGKDAFENNVVIPAFKKKGIGIYTADAAFIADLKKGTDFIEERWLKNNAKSRGVDGKAALEFYKKTAASIAAGGN